MKLRMIVLMVAAGLLAACSSSSSGGSASNTPSPSTSSSAANAPADAAAAKGQITTNWQTFFAYNTPRAVAQSLIEGGAAMAPALAFAARLQQSGKVKQGAQVTNVTFTSPTQAAVTYKLLNGSAVLLPNANGTAVLVNGKWVVSKSTFCTLVQLGSGGKAVPGC